MRDKAATKYGRAHNGEADGTTNTGLPDVPGAPKTTKPATASQQGGQTAPDTGNEALEGATQSHVDKSTLSLSAPK